MPEGSFKTRNLEGYATATNVSLRERLGTNGIVANDNTPPDGRLSTLIRKYDDVFIIPVR